MEIEILINNTTDKAELIHDINSLRFRYKDIDITIEDEIAFSALTTLRKTLDSKGIMLLIQGSRKDVFPSGMQMDMRSSAAYIHIPGVFNQKPRVVNIFDPADDATMLGTVAEQHTWKRAFLDSFKAKHQPATIELIQGDITKIAVDAIVNAANTSLLGGGGVDGAIHKAGGSAILDACMKIRAAQGGCKTGEAVITTAGFLPATYVIHTVGPVWNGGNKEERHKLSRCYANSLQLAIANGVKTISFPNISTGIYHFPKQEAAEVAIKTVREYTAAFTGIEKVYFVCFDAENYSIYQRILESQ